MVAKTWGAGIAESIGKPLPDCNRCRRPDSANERKSWGCDTETKKPVFTTGCSRCFGSDPACPDCTDGVISYNRCPSAVIESFGTSARRAAGRALRAYIQLDGRGVLPNAGGFEDQTTQFGNIVDVVDHERGRWAHIQEDYRQRERARARR